MVSPPVVEKQYFLFLVAINFWLGAVDGALHEALESDGIGCFELHLLASDGVGEAELKGMEAKTIEWVVVIFTTIAAIANDGMP